MTVGILMEKGHKVVLSAIEDFRLLNVGWYNSYFSTFAVDEFST